MATCLSRRMSPASYVVLKPCLAKVLSPCPTVDDMRAQRRQQTPQLLFDVTFKNTYNRGEHQNPAHQWLQLCSRLGRPIFLLWLCIALILFKLECQGFCFFYFRFSKLHPRVSLRCPVSAPALHRSSLVPDWAVPLLLQFLSSPALLRLGRPVMLQFCSAPASLKAGRSIFAVVSPCRNPVEG